MVLNIKFDTLTLVRQTAIVVLMLLFSACSTVNTTYQQPTIEDKSTTTTSTPSPVPASNRPAQLPENTSTTTNNTVERTVDKSNTVPVAPQTSTPVAQNPAVIALIDTAQLQHQQGDLYSAQSSLQRAQRISPRDPQVYYELANIHRELHDYGLAEQVALKGVSIVQGQTQQLRRFWSLIAQIRSDAGDSKGANQAKIKADRY